MSVSRYISDVALRELDALAYGGVGLALSGFEKVESEAADLQQKVYESYRADVPDIDPEDAAHAAELEAIDYRLLMFDLRQAITNLMAVGIHHLYEQHQNQIEYLRSKAGLPALELKQFTEWAKVNELRLVANTVKHAEGSAAKQLRAIRPDLFVYPPLRGTPKEVWQMRYPRATKAPLGGEDLYVSRDDLDCYREAVRDLWVDVRSQS